MGIVDRPAPDEPEERPDQLGRHLLRIQAQYPGEWREAFEYERRETAVRVEGCLLGRGVGRIAGVLDIAGWEARVIDRTEEGKRVYVVRVRWTPPKAPRVETVVRPDGPSPSERLKLDDDPVVEAAGVETIARP